MRWSLGYKIFCLFLPLTLVSLFFGSLVFTSLTLIENNNRHILHIKDFQIQLKSLERWRAKLTRNVAFPEKKTFLAEIEKTKLMARTIPEHQTDLSGNIARRTQNFAALSENFSKAYLELFGRYVLRKELAQRAANLLNQIEILSHAKSPMSPQTAQQDRHQSQIRDLLTILKKLQDAIQKQASSLTIQQEKKKVEEKLKNLASKEYHSLIDTALQIFDEEYINILAIKNREDFLESTAEYFFTTSERTIDAIIESFNTQKDNYRILILAVILFAIFLNLAFWLVTSRYINNFIELHNKAINSLEKREEISLPKHVPNDEIGDLSRSLIDLAERLKESQSQLSWSENKYRNLVENLNDALWETDDKHRIAFISNAIIPILGHTPDELHGSPLLDLLHPEESEDIKQSLKDHLSKQQPFGDDYTLSHQAGKTTIVELYGQPVFNEESFIGFSGMLRDITDKKQLEQQLQQSQKIESIGRLAGGVAHDYNNMLSVIIGYAEITMEDLPPGQPVYNNLKEIHSAAMRSMRITRQLLAFARKQTISPEVLKVNDTINGMMKMLQRLIGENIELSWSPGTNLWMIRMDPSQIDQILANLCINSRDAIKGVGKIRIETRNITLDSSYFCDDLDFIPGDYVLLTVSDDGSGMDATTQKQMFEPFFTTKQEKGTGLGLSTVYGIVKQNKGVINVYSEPNKGTTFNIYIPKHSVESGEPPLLRAKEVPLGNNETVLLVEDELAITNMVRNMLETLNYNAIPTTSPLEALNLVASSQKEIHLVLTDLIMPEMNGKELLEKIQVHLPTVKSLYMSGYTSDIIAHQGILEGGIDFIQKPFSKRTLAEKMRAVLQ